jgi:hypothetical protein
MNKEKESLLASKLESVLNENESLCLDDETDKRTLLAKLVPVARKFIESNNIKSQLDAKTIDPFETPYYDTEPPIKETVFGIGDAVRFKDTQKKALGNRYREEDGVVIGKQIDGKGQRYYRVNFGKSPYDYDDVISFRLEGAK